MALGRGLGPPFVLPKVSPSPKILGSPRLFLPPKRRGVAPSGNMICLIRSARSSLLNSQEALNATMPYYRSTATFFVSIFMQPNATVSQYLLQMTMKQEHIADRTYVRRMPLFSRICNLGF